MVRLGDKSVGNIVKLNVNGTARNFIVVHQGRPSSTYDSSCNGTWLLMEDLYESRVWDSSDNDYANSDIHSYLNNTFVNLFDSDIKSVIKQVKLPYTKGTGSGGATTSGSSGISAKVFLLSYTEVGYSGSSAAHIEGVILGNFTREDDSKRVAYLNGSAIRWWLRSPATDGRVSARYVAEEGTAGYNYVTNSYGVRPALVFPSDLRVESDGTIVASSFSGYANIGGVNKDLSGGYVNIGGAWKEISGMYMRINGAWKKMA